MIKSRPRMRVTFGVALAIAGTLSASAASAQQMPPDDRRIDIQLFEPAIGTNGYLTVEGAEPMAPGLFVLSLGMTYLTKPLSVYTVDQANGNSLSNRSEVVNSMFAG